jgi:hypothetical protein
LEEAYSQIIKERWEKVNDPKYICVNQDNGEYLTFSYFDEAKKACDQFNSDDNTKDWVVKYDGDVVYPKESEVGTPAYDISINPRGGYVESFIHGIQPISEAKKKVNPWAIEKSIEKKTGKKFGKKHKEEIIKGIKKSAKKSGKKITSDKVKGKK